MSVWRPAMLLTGVFALSACMDVSGVPLSFGENDAIYAKAHGLSVGRLFRPTKAGVSPFKLDPDPCGIAVAKRTAGIDWAKAETIEMTVKEGWISPITLSLKKGQPYILRYVNFDDQTRALRGRDFFSSSAVAGLKVGDQNFPAACITTVHAAAKQTVELRLVPEAAGDYELEDNLAIWGIPHTARERFSLVSVQ